MMMKTVRNLLEEAKRRTVLVCLWVLGLAYLMSLTSSSIWWNVPVALLLTALVRSFLGELQFRWRTSHPFSIPSAHTRSSRRPRYRRKDPRLAALSDPKSAYDLWRQGVEAPEVEAALEELTQSVVKEWVTNLWFRSVSSDEEFPDELANLINSVFAELSQRVRRINLIDLLTQKLVDLVASHLELFRRTQARVGVDTLGSLSAEERDENIKQTLSATGELHPALVSPESEYRVLHKLIGGMIPLILRPEDGKCKVAGSLSRELLACSVMRPVMNLMNPGFINMLIENAAAQSRAAAPAPEVAKPTAKRTPDRPPIHKENSDVGLEMVAVPPPKGGQGMKSSSSESSLTKLGSEDISGKVVRNDSGSPILLIEGPTEGVIVVPRKLEIRGVSGNYGHQGARESKENWAQLLEVVNKQKTIALAPEHLDNLWTKGRNYKKRDKPGKPGETSVIKDQSASRPPQNLIKEQSISHPLALEPPIPETKFKPEVDSTKTTASLERCGSSSQNPIEPNLTQSTQLENSVAQDDRKAIKMVDEEVAPPRIRRSRSIGAELDGWQALAHPGGGLPSLLRADEGPGLGPGFDLDLALRKRKGKKSQLEGTESMSLVSQLICNQLQVDVVGAHFEKGGSKTFAVYSIFVTDLQNRTWEVQRRFRNFEQLHRSLKDKPYYNLSLPAKRFLSSNLDSSFIRQRCALLDKYLKDLLAIPSIAERHEVWDFLSANSQTYAFGESPSMFKTLTSNVDDAVDDMFRQFRGVPDAKPVPISSASEAGRQLMMGTSISPTTSHLPILTNSSAPTRSERRAPPPNIWEDEEFDSTHGGTHHLGWSPEYDFQLGIQASRNPFGSDPGIGDALFVGSTQERSLSEGHSPVGSLAGSDQAEDDNLAIPPDWGPPKVSVPLLNLVDVIFELQGRGWIRRQVFWIAKQVLQLGMGDAIDDFLLGKIQELRKEEVVAGGIRWLRRILWPDGIFLTKHPSRQANNSGQESSFEQRLEAARRAGVVREIILDRAPAALVSLIGRKQYQRCATDLYFFLQSAVCLKQLTYNLLEMLLLAAFPELHDVVLEVRNL